MTIELDDKEVELIIGKLDTSSPEDLHTPTYKRQFAPLEKVRSEKLVTKLRKIQQEARS